MTCQWQQRWQREKLNPWRRMTGSLIFTSGRYLIKAHRLSHIQRQADTRSHIYGRILDAFKRTNIAEQIGTLYEDPVRFFYSPMDTVEPTYQASHICVSSRSLHCFIRASRMSRASSLWFHPKMQKRYVRHRKWRRDEEKRRKKRATKLSLSWSLGYPTSSALPD